MFPAGIFLGAFLLFLVQPLVAKQILPWFGGGPAVWSTTLLFFQVALVGGYAYAHGTRRLGAGRQAALHLLLLAGALVTVSVLPSADWKPADASAPALRVLAILAAHAGVPFVLLAATAPLLQDWHARVRPDRRTYRLYALSNAGSLGALVAYPFVVERWLTLPAQATLWSALFAAFVATAAGCAWQLRAAGPARPATAPHEAARHATVDPPPVSHWLGWLALPAIGSALLMATSGALTQNVAPVPLLWVVPLAVYLLTWIVAFGGGYRRHAVILLWIPALAGAVLVLRGAGFGSLGTQAVAYLGALAIGGLACHGEVARLQPHVRYLTGYYLALAAGGAIGGAAVALGAPLLFDSLVEFPLACIATTVVVAGAAFDEFAGRQAASARRTAGISLALIVAVVAAVILRRGEDPLVVVAASRNFYGIVSVVDDRPGARQPVRRLYHGQILHGVQFRDPALARRPTSYYVDGTGLDLAIREHPRRAAGEPLAIGVVGLGAGTVAAMGRAGDRIRFYELDPDVVDIARTYFTYLRDSPATVEVVTGDGRLALEREAADPAGRAAFDVLALDAFSGDAVPVHLLTREAFTLYRQVLKADGLIAVNVSNRYLDLRPVIRAHAAEAGMEMRHVQRAASREPGSTTSNWLIVTANATWLAKYPRRSTDEARVPWTDSFSSLLAVLR